MTAFVQCGCGAVRCGGPCPACSTQRSGGDHMRPMVYLAGPIAGQTYDGAVEWREAARSYLNRHGIAARSPMRGKEFLRSAGVLTRHSYNDHALATCHGVTMRDRFDCTTSDVVLFNFLGASQVSIGSCIELGWADGARRPIVVAMEPDSNPHDHLIVQGVAGFVLPTIEEALAIVVSILKDDPL